MTFGEFLEDWQDRVGPTLPPATMRDLYLADEDGGRGIDLLSSLDPEASNKISMTLALAIEQSFAKSAKLTKIEFAKHRMIHDRHMIQLFATEFDEDYHKSSTERALFMIYHHIPLIWIFSAFNIAKNRIIRDYLQDETGLDPVAQQGWISAITTLLMIELNSISRVYSYFGRANKDNDFNFIPPVMGHQKVCQDLGLQDRNSQIAPPKAKPQPDLELF